MEPKAGDLPCPKLNCQQRQVEVRPIKLEKGGDEVWVREKFRAKNADLLKKANFGLASVMKSLAGGRAFEFLKGHPSENLILSM